MVSSVVSDILESVLLLFNIQRCVSLFSGGQCGDDLLLWHSSSIVIGVTSLLLQQTKAVLVSLPPPDIFMCSKCIVSNGVLYNCCKDVRHRIGIQAMFALDLVLAKFQGYLVNLSPVCTDSNLSRLFTNMYDIRMSHCKICQLYAKMSAADRHVVTQEIVHGNAHAPFSWTMGFHKSKSKSPQQPHFHIFFLHNTYTVCMHFLVKYTPHVFIT